MQTDWLIISSISFIRLKSSDERRVGRGGVEMSGTFDISWVALLVWLSGIAGICV